MKDAISMRNPCSCLVLFVAMAVASPAVAQETGRALAAAGGRDDAQAAADGVDAHAAAGAVRERLAAFGDWFQRSMDLECSGRVPVLRLVEIMDPGRSRPRQMNWVMSLDADEDGFVEPGEVGVGLWDNLDHQVERRMHGDVDGDGVLSLREYSLFVPDPGAETNATNASDYQEERFASFDRDGDRRVSRGEIVDEFARSYIGRHWGRMVLFHLGRADRDRDGAVGRDELADALAAAEGSAASEAVDAWFRTLAGEASASAEPRLVLAELPRVLLEAGSTATGRAELEAPLAPLLAPVCGPPARGPR